MTHSAIDQSAVTRLKARLGQPPATPGGGETADRPGEAAALIPPPGLTMASLVTRAKAKIREAAAPVVAKARKELADAAAEDQAGLRAEVATLRDELIRTRAEHAAELAALHEEVAATRHAVRHPNTGGAA